MTEVQNVDTTKCWGRCGVPAPSFVADGNGKWDKPLRKAVRRFLTKVNILVTL